jgi:hypothetical protein
MKTRKTRNKQPYVALLNETSDTAVWRALSHGARVLYASLKREYNPGIQTRWDGRIDLSLRDAEERMGSKRGQIARWYRELQHYGFIVMTAPGCLGFEGKGKAPRWRLTGTTQALKWSRNRDQRERPKWSRNRDHNNSNHTLAGCWRARRVRSGAASSADGRSGSG